jgi:hypothetical protein
MSTNNPSRRQWLQTSACALLASAAQSTLAQPGHLREMQIHKVPELGLIIWVENQPPWEAELSHASGHPSFIVQSPDQYHPPTVMTYASWPHEHVPDVQLAQVANTAIQRASQNFGLNLGQARAVSRSAAQYGVLSGFEGQFVGRVQGVAMDVKVFVGQTSGRFPVALSLYTLKGKMGHLGEVLRRSWGQLAYLAG